jgi:hypothetical protein
MLAFDLAESGSARMFINSSSRPLLDRFEFQSVAHNGKFQEVMSRDVVGGAVAIAVAVKEQQEEEEEEQQQQERREQQCSGLLKAQTQSTGILTFKPCNCF